MEESANPNPNPTLPATPPPGAPDKKMALIIGGTVVVVFIVGILLFSLIGSKSAKNNGSGGSNGSSNGGSNSGGNNGGTLGGGNNNGGSNGGGTPNNGTPNNNGSNGGNNNNNPTTTPIEKSLPTSKLPITPQVFSGQITTGNKFTANPNYNISARVFPSPDAKTVQAINQIATMTTKTLSDGSTLVTFQAKDPYTVIPSFAVKPGYTLYLSDKYIKGLGVIEDLGDDTFYLVDPKGYEAQF